MEAWGTPRETPRDTPRDATRETPRGTPRGASLGTPRGDARSQSPGTQREAAYSMDGFVSSRTGRLRRTPSNSVLKAWPEASPRGPEGARRRPPSAPREARPSPPPWPAGDQRLRRLLLPVSDVEMAGSLLAPAGLRPPISEHLGGSAIGRPGPMGYTPALGGRQFHKRMRK